MAVLCKKKKFESCMPEGEVIVSHCAAPPSGVMRADTPAAMLPVCLSDLCFVFKYDFSEVKFVGQFGNTGEV